MMSIPLLLIMMWSVSVRNSLESLGETFQGRASVIGT